MNLQRVLGDANFGLPYWDWAADGQRPPAQQKLSKVWAIAAMGSSGSPVTTGPFAFSAGDPTTFRVRIESNVNGQLVQANHGRTYLPLQTALASLREHRINDPMASLVSAPMRPADVLDMTATYVYDSLTV